MSLFYAQLKEELERLDALMLSVEESHRPLLQHIHPAHYQSACNLLHYLALRSQDIRGLQELLHEQGLSALTNSESHIRSQLLAILRHLGHTPREAAPTFRGALERLHHNTRQLFGPSSSDVIPCIMVSFDTSFAEDFEAVKKLLQSGMNIARINCAHDNEAIWTKMIQNVQAACAHTGLSCLVYMDLAGPKIRTEVRGQKKDRLKISEGDRFCLSDHKYFVDELPVVGCSLPGIIPQLQVGDRVLFDDGLIEATVVGKRLLAAELQVERISSKKPFLKTEKGINFPDTAITLPALTDYDRQCLPFILEHADLVGYSFVQSVADLEQLQQAMGERKRPIIIKVETPPVVQNLPALLLQGMKEEYFGVMIARGDLAVEIGFERMSEVQEEILWLCEAAHTPVIWATQVLESLNKLGVATRAEVTDAAHAAMAECVLVNKGAYTVQVIETLKDILYRSGGHHAKKRYTFRPLSLAKNFLSNPDHTP